MKHDRVGLIILASLTLLTNCGVDVPDGADNSSDGIVRGKTEKKLPQVVAVRFNRFNGGWVLCTGTYFASRIVVTAAHCLKPDAIPGQGFVYFGDDYLTDVESLPVIPEPGQPSNWARVETAAAHPDYDTNINYPDFAILHLDRELPFAPIPLLRDPVTASDKKGEIAGWGGSKALTADISQVEGFGIKRSAKVKILGSPTEADYHPDDPNPGILDPAIRPDAARRPTAWRRRRTPARATRAARCWSSGRARPTWRASASGPASSARITRFFSRIDPFLAFFDDAVTRAGKAPIVPRLECVEPGGRRSFLRALRLSQRQRLTVTIPYGRQNLFARTRRRRGRAIRARRQRVRLRGDVHGRRTAVVEADATVCGLDDGGGERVLAGLRSRRPTFVCAKACDAQFAAECADPHAQSTAVHQRLRVEHGVLQLLQALWRRVGRVRRLRHRAAAPGRELGLLVPRLPAPAALPQLRGRAQRGLRLPR